MNILFAALAIVCFGVYAWAEIGVLARREANREQLRLKHSIATLEADLRRDDARAVLVEMTPNPYEFAYEPGAKWAILPVSNRAVVAPHHPTRRD